MEEGGREKSWRMVRSEAWPKMEMKMEGKREIERIWEKRENGKVRNVSQMSLGFIKWKWSLVNDVGW